MEDLRVIKRYVALCRRTDLSSAEAPPSPAVVCQQCSVPFIT